MRTVTDIKPNYINEIANALRQVAYSAGASMHPEFMRAIKTIAVAYGITENELRNGCTRESRAIFKEDITAALRSILSAAGRNVDSEFRRAVVSFGLSFGIRDQDL